MEVKEVAGLLIYSLLQLLLCGGLGRHVTDTSSRNIILCKRINQSLAHLGCICNLGG